MGCAWCARASIPRPPGPTLAVFPVLPWPTPLKVAPFFLPLWLPCQVRRHYSGSREQPRDPSRPGAPCLLCITCPRRLSDRSPCRAGPETRTPPHRRTRGRPRILSPACPGVHRGGASLACRPSSRRPSGRTVRSALDAVTDLGRPRPSKPCFAAWLSPTGAAFPCPGATWCPSASTSSAFMIFLPGPSSNTSEAPFRSLWGRRRNRGIPEGVTVGTRSLPSGV